jgi:hypothetical protein
MAQQLEGPRRAALARDGAARRLRHATQVSVAAMVALGGAFAALAAGSTQPKTASAPTTSSSPPAPAKVTQAPAPPLVASHRAAPPPPPAAQAPATPAPTPSYQPPVVSSGGS